MPRHYVYALIDPRTRVPRYIGKGISLRTEAHIRQARVLSDEALVVGAETADVLLDDQERTSPQAKDKQTWLLGLLRDGFTHADIARVIARDLDEHAALTLESFLIHHVYGKEALFNVQAGHHAERFCPLGALGHWDAKSLAADYPYYVYLLRDPGAAGEVRDGVFYVGKGSGQRLAQHFLAADQIQGEPGGHERLRMINRLREQGLLPEQIGCVVACVATEQEALLIEALLIKFVFGVDVLTNRVAGHHAWAIRPKDHWDPLPGFDLARVVDPNSRQDRSELLALLLAEGLSNALECVKQLLAGMVRFGDYKVLDAGELGMEAPLAGSVLKVFTRRKSIQAELRPRTKAQRVWMRAHFRALDAERLLRGDGVFIPSCWRGARNMTDSPEEISIRIRLLAELVSTQQREALGHEARALLATPTDVGDPVLRRDAAHHQNPVSIATPTDTPEGSDVEEGQNGDRSSLLNQHGDQPVIADHCNVRLRAIADLFPDIAFDHPRRRDAGEIAMEGLIGAEDEALGADLKVSCRASGYGLELRGRVQTRKAWLHSHLAGLGCTLVRAMNPDEVVFLPASWRGATNMAKTEGTAAYRIGLLLQIISAVCADDLDDEARRLLTD